MPAQHIQGAFADAARGAEHGNADHPCSPGSRRQPSISKGAAASRLSKRSSTPPWPGISVPLSLSPAKRLHRLSSQVAHHGDTRPRPRSRGTSDDNGNREQPGCRHRQQRAGQPGRPTSRPRSCRGDARRQLAHAPGAPGKIGAAVGQPDDEQGIQHRTLAMLADPCACAPVPSRPATAPALRPAQTSAPLTRCGSKNTHSRARLQNSSASHSTQAQRRRPCPRAATRAARTARQPPAETPRGGRPGGLRRSHAHSQAAASSTALSATADQTAGSSNTAPTSSTAMNSRRDDALRGSLRAHRRAPASGHSDAGARRRTPAPPRTLPR